MSTNAEYVAHALALFEADVVYCVFDTETTDKLSTPTAKIMQVAARRYIWNHATGRSTLVGELSVLINDPDMQELSEGAFNTHHITLADCHKRTNPSPREAWTAFLNLADNATLMGQNIVGFDIPFVNRELTRHGFRRQLNLGRAIDTLFIARHIWDLDNGYGRPGYKLRALAERLGVKTDPKLDHDALGDIDTTWAIWLAMQPHLETYRRKFIDGTPNQYKYEFAGLDARWKVA